MMRIDFKKVYDVQAFISDQCYLVIKQDNYPDESSEVLLSHEQARRIAQYVFHNQAAIEELWNSGLQEEKEGS